MPVACMTYSEAKKFCQDAGKRLCTKAEWLDACGGLVFISCGTIYGVAC